MLRLLSSPGGSDAGASCPRVSYLDRFPGPVRLGRHTDCEIRCLAERNREVVNAAVSRFHAQLTCSREGGYTVKDTSANGTVVNGHRITGPQMLKTGDIITLGMPTYKATSDASAEVTNPFVFEYTAPQDLPAPVAASEDQQNESQAQEVLAQGRRLKQLEKDRATPSLPEARANDRRRLREDHTVPSHLEDHAEVPDLGREQTNESLADTSDGVRRHRGKRVSRVAVDKQFRGDADPSRAFIDLSEGPPEAERAQRIRTPRLQSEHARLGLQDSKVEGKKASEVLRSSKVGFKQASEVLEVRRARCLEASAGRELEEDGGLISKGAPDQNEDGRESVRKRLLEVVRAKHRADERQNPLKKRGPETDTLTSELLERVKRLRTQSGVSESAPRTGTPISLADDCALLEVPDVGRSPVRRQNQHSGIDLNDPFDVSDSLRPASLENIEHREEPETERPFLQPPEEPLLDSAPSPTKEAARSEAPADAQKPAEALGKRSGEAELLEMLGEELQCVICQSYLCAAHALPCSHTFCGDCLTEWLSKKRHCPTCRQPVGSASPTPVHNIDSMIERAAKRCMTSEEKADFDRRRGVFKMSKKLTNDAPKAAGNRTAQSRSRTHSNPRTLHNPFLQSGTMQAISSHVDEALARLDERERMVRQRMQLEERRRERPQVERARLPMSRQNEVGSGNWFHAQAPAAQGEGHGARQAALRGLLSARSGGQRVVEAMRRRAAEAHLEGGSARGSSDTRNFGERVLPVESPADTGEAACGVCGQTFAQGQLQVPPPDGRDGPKCHVGCLSGIRGLHNTGQQ